MVCRDHLNKISRDIKKATLVSMDFDVKLGEEELPKVKKTDVDISTAYLSVHEHISMTETLRTNLLIILSVNSGDNGFLVS